MDTGTLIMRTFFGLAMAGHGAQKLLGLFGGRRDRCGCCAQRCHGKAGAGR